MRWFWAFPIFFFILSCEYFLSKEERTQQLANRKMATINMNEVDQYPLFEGCDETASKVEQRQCFETQITNHFKNAVQNLVFEVENDVIDTLWIDFKIDEEGLITIAEIIDSNNLKGLLTGLKKELIMQLNDSTNVAPAIKRGVPVSLKFRLPLVIETVN